MKLLRTVIAFIAIPAVMALAYSLGVAFMSFSSSAGFAYMPFWLGIIAYILFQAVFHKPMRTYVFGHELTHALAGILSGATIKRFKAGKNSGHVLLDKDNVWITLAPYFFPIYAFAITICYIFLGWFIDIKLFYPYFLFFIGLTVAFHIALTWYILRTQQPDLKVYGVFFSLVVTAAMNLIFFSILAALVFPGEMKIFSILIDAIKNTWAIYSYLISGIKIIFDTIITPVRR